jgi:hypothetical protein
MASIVPNFEFTNKSFPPVVFVFAAKVCIELVLITSTVVAAIRDKIFVDVLAPVSVGLNLISSWFGT